jgi:hypothetical protein
MEPVLLRCGEHESDFSPFGHGEGARWTANADADSAVQVARRAGKPCTDALW